mmetsp:Transcript_66829/g.175987  ORF Transcript_66829/g.175987 Transcript_66829/m.175987 type:complete len:338 (+) Transcript_66829:582-1595(+)
MSASDWHSARSAPLQSRTQARSTIRFARGAYPPWDGWLSMYSSAVMFVVVISISTAYSSSGMFTHLSMMYQSKFWKQPMVKGDTCMRLAVTARGSSKIFDRSSVTTGRASAAGGRGRRHGGHGRHVVAEVALGAPAVVGAGDRPTVVDDAGLQVLAPGVASARALGGVGEILGDALLALPGAAAGRGRGGRNGVGLHAVALALADADLALGQLEAADLDRTGVRDAALRGLAFLGRDRAHEVQELEAHDRRLAGARRGPGVVLQPQREDGVRLVAAREVQAQRPVALDRREDADTGERLTAVLTSHHEVRGIGRGSRHPVAAPHAQVLPVVRRPHVL